MINYITQLFSSPKRFFLTNFFFWGIIFFFLVPPFQAPDEYVHFCRIFQLSYGTLVLDPDNLTIGDNLPSSLKPFIDLGNAVVKHNEKKFDYKKLKNFIQLPLEKKLSFFKFPSTLTYSPIQYLPQTLAVFVGNTFDFPVCISYYLGRFLQLCMTGFLLYLSIVYIPFGKWLMVMLSLSPMTLFLSMSNSADPILFSCSFLLISIVLHSIYDEQFKINTTVILLLLFSIATLTTSKSGAYCIMIGIILLIPSRIFSQKTYIYILKGALLAFGCILALLWFSKTKPILEFLAKEQFTYHTKLIFMDIFKYVTILITTLFKSGQKIYVSFFNLGWFDTPLPKSMAYLWGCIICLLSVFYDNKKYTITFFTRCTFLSISIAMTVIVLTSMYLACGWTEQNIINGIQGRYFLPFAPLFFFGCSNIINIQNIPSINTLRSYATCLLQLFIILFLGVTVVTMYNRYYVT